MVGMAAASRGVLVVAAVALSAVAVAAYLRVQYRA